MDSLTFSYPSTDLWKPVTSRSCTRRRCNPHSGFWFCNWEPGIRNSEPSLHTTISLKTAAYPLKIFIAANRVCPHRFPFKLQYFTKRPDSRAKLSLFSGSHPNYFYGTIAPESERADFNFPISILRTSHFILAAIAATCPTTCPIAIHAP